MISRPSKLLTTLVLLALNVFSSHESRAEQKLSGHIPNAAANAAVLGRLPADRRLHLAVGLPLRNKESLDRFIQDVYDPSHPQYHQYLSPEEFRDRFGPSAADYEALVAFLTNNGFTVVEAFPNRLLVDVEASVASIEKAFHIKLNEYNHPSEKRKFFAPDVEPSLEVSFPVLHITGLDNFQLPQPAGLKVQPKPADGGDPRPQTGSGPGGSYRGFDFRAAYAPGVTLTGAGQYVGLLQFDGYYPADIFAYAASCGLSNVPLQNIMMNGFSGTPGPNNVEVALDIEMVIAMAPGISGVIVYEGSSGNSILNRMAVDNVAKQLSASWTFGTDANTPQIFQQFLAQGQQYFNASGDSGAYTTTVPSPTDSPYITSVGGTTLSTRGPVQGWIGETTWSWFNTGQGNGASSGGFSPTWAIPAYQQGMDMSTNHGSLTKRNIPDVCMVSDNVWIIYNNGTQTFVGGDSIASPLWAGFIALANQQAAINGQPPVGFINPAIYAIGRSTNYAACFHDVKTGNNTNSISPAQYFATNGFDLCTGWGSPTGKGLINALAPPPNARVLVAVSNSLSLETCGSGNGAVDPGEAVVMSFSLQNIGLVNTTNLVAALLNTGGVVAASSPQSYGVLTSQGAAVSRSFVFTATGSCGQTATPTLRLQDGSSDLGLVTFSVPLGATLYSLTQSFDTVTSPALPPGWVSTISAGESNWTTVSTFRQTPSNSASVVGSAIAGTSDLTSPPFPISSTAAKVTFRNYFATELNGNNSADGYDGGVLEISYGGGPYSDILAAGGSFVTGGYNTTLDSTTGNPLGGRQAWAGTSGGFIMTTVNLPAAAAGQIVRLRWRLATDNDNASGSSIWCIDTFAAINGSSCCSPATNSDLTIAQTVSPDPAQIGQTITYSLAVTNLGPAPATSVTITDTLPNNVTFAGASPGFINISNLVVGTFPLLTNGGRTNFFIAVNPTAAGLLTNSLSVTSSVNDTNEANSSSTVVSSASAASPVITTPPSNQIAVVGSDVSFNVQATGDPPLTYQWQFTGSDVPGATLATLLLTNVQPAQAGSYLVIITNSSGSATSAPVSLKVLVPPTISLSSLNVTPTNVSILLNSVSGLTYTLEYKDLLTDPQWTPILPPQPGTGGVVTLQDPQGASLLSRFYRVNCY